jgi:hypothetical protein
MADAARTVGTRFRRLRLCGGLAPSHHMVYCSPEYAPLQTLLADASSRLRRVEFLAGGSGTSRDERDKKTENKARYKWRERSAN